MPSAARISPRGWLRSAWITVGFCGLVASEWAFTTWMLLSWMNRARKQSTMKMPEPADPLLHQMPPAARGRSHGRRGAVVVVVVVVVVVGMGGGVVVCVLFWAAFRFLTYFCALASDDSWTPAVIDGR